MSNQTIGTVKVQVGTSVNPRVSTINYGGITSLKGASDLNTSGAQEGEVVVYRAATNSFEVAPVPATGIGALDAGTF